MRVCKRQIRDETKFYYTAIDVKMGCSNTGHRTMRNYKAQRKRTNNNETRDSASTDVKGAATRMINCHEYMNELTNMIILVTGLKWQQQPK